MNAKVTWEKELIFTGLAESGYPVKMDSKSSPESGVGPVEMVALALAGCTAMDVISILTKQKQKVSKFEVKVHADRTNEYPKVITKATLDYVLTGISIEEEGLLKAIDLSIKKYCPVHAMLKNAFPIDFHYSIFEEHEDGGNRLTKEGLFHPS